MFITYLAEHPALAALEILNYAGKFRNLQGYMLYRLDLPDGKIEQVRATVDPQDYAQTRPYGDTWVQQGRRVGLRVPSVTSVEAWNLLLNQSHPDFTALSATPLGPYTFDRRVEDLLK